MAIHRLCSISLGQKSTERPGLRDIEDPRRWAGLDNAPDVHQVDRVNHVAQDFVADLLSVPGATRERRLALLRTVQQCAVEPLPDAWVKAVEAQLDTADEDTRLQAQVSLMPEGFDENLTRQEVSDLFAFLRSQTSRETAMAGG